MVMHHHQPEYHSEVSFCYGRGQSHNRFYSIFINTEYTDTTRMCLFVVVVFVFCFFLLLLLLSFFFWGGGGGAGEGEIWHLVACFLLSFFSFFFFFTYIVLHSVNQDGYNTAQKNFVFFWVAWIPWAARPKRFDPQRPKRPSATAGPRQAKQSVYLSACSINSCAEQSQKLSPDNQLLKPEAKDRPAAK